MSEPRSISSPSTEQRLDALEHRLGALEQHLERLRELVVRAYEDTPGNAARVNALRRSASYSRAFDPDPQVTIRMGIYRPGAELGRRTIPSILEQTHQNWELVMVLDGPDDEIAALLADIGDPRFRVLTRPRNGPYPADPSARWRIAGAHPFNEAVAAARGSWVAPIDQDDKWSSDHLEVLLEAARHSRAELVYGACRVVVGDHGETYFGAWPPVQGQFGFQAAIYHAGLTSFLYDANAYLLDSPADWQLARRMLEAGVRFDYIPRIVATYYVDSGSQSYPWWVEQLEVRGRFPQA